MLVDDRSFNRRVIGAVIAALIIAVVAAYILAQVVLRSSHYSTQNSIGSIIDDALPVAVASKPCVRFARFAAAVPSRRANAALAHFSQTGPRA
jgi:hypothetical protein